MTIIDTYLYSAPGATNEIDITTDGFAPYVYSAPSAALSIDIGEVLPQVVAPIISPAGGIINSNIYASITCPTAGATIYMTLNGDEPTTSSALYEGSFLVDKTLTVKAMAVKSGMAASNVTVVDYIMVVNTVAEPVITPSGGAYNVPVTVGIATDTIDAAIYYTTNGTTPSVLSNLYTAPFILSSAQVVRAVAVKTGMLDSPVASATFNIVLETKVASPVLTPSQGIFADPITVTIETTTVNAELYYTLDNTTPTMSSILYDGTPISITTSAPLKVIGFKTGLDNSDMVTAEYVIQSTAIPTSFIAVNNDTDPFGTSARLSWNMVDTAGLSGFKIVYGLSSGVYTEEAIITDPFANTHTLTGLTTQTTYFFAIKALYGTLEGNISDESSCLVEDVVKPPAPTDFVASITADGKGVWLRWVNPTSDFSHVVLVKNDDHIPLSPTDGEQIYTGTEEEYTDRDI